MTTSISRGAGPCSPQPPRGPRPVRLTDVHQLPQDVREHDRRPVGQLEQLGEWTRQDVVRIGTDEPGLPQPALRDEPREPADLGMHATNHPQPTGTPLDLRPVAGVVAAAALRRA